jgi:DNA mismatch endonuclease (patch repair protein)
MDTISEAERSLLMGRIRNKNTKPELALRSALHRMGYRFRVCVKDLPGMPDIVFRSRRVAIFVHGCFWHRHSCKFAYNPKTRRDFWQRKFRSNVERDQECAVRLTERGWRVIVVWECEIENAERLANLTDAIGPPSVGADTPAFERP